MRITHKKTIDKQLVGKAQAKLDAARAYAAKEMADLESEISKIKVVGSRYDALQESKIQK